MATSLIHTFENQISIDYDLRCDTTSGYVWERAQGRIEAYEKAIDYIKKYLNWI